MGKVGLLMYSMVIQLFIIMTSSVTQKTSESGHARSRVYEHTKEFIVESGQPGRRTKKQTSHKEGRGDIFKIWG